MIRSSPSRPKQFEPWPCSPAVGLPVPLVREVGEVGMAFRRAEDHAAAAAAVAAVGPPRGAYFSRRKLRQPLPPSPPRTKIVTRSTNMISLGPTTPASRRLTSRRAGLTRIPGAQPVVAGSAAGTTLIRRPSWSNLTLPSISEKIVQSRPTPTFLPGPPLRALLAADDAPGLGRLAAVELDPQHLGIRVAAVAARSLTFLMSHDSCVL